MKIICGTIDELLGGTGDVLMSISPPVPEVDAIRLPPIKHGIYRLIDYATGSAATEKTKCYWCKSTDLWLAGTEEHPHWVCRRCHPPAPDAERNPSNKPVTKPATGE